MPGGIATVDVARVRSTPPENCTAPAARPRGRRRGALTTAKGKPLSNHSTVAAYTERDGWTGQNGYRVAQCQRCASVALADTLQVVTDDAEREAVVCKQCAARMRRHGV